MLLNGYEYWRTNEQVRLIKVIFCVVIPPIGWYVMSKILLNKYSDDKTINTSIALLSALFLYTVFSAIIGVSFHTPSAIPLAYIFVSVTPLFAILKLVKSKIKKIE